MAPKDMHARLDALDRPRGRERRILRSALGSLVLEGLDTEAASRLDARWGPFVAREVSGDGAPVAPVAPVVAIDVLDAGEGGWLPAAAAGEPYRLERPPGGPVVSYHFALAGGETIDGDAPHLRLGISRDADEPIERILDNACRHVVARLAIRRGGLPLHGAGVLDGEGAQVFVGPSRAGKSTAVRLSAPRPSLGDDFAVVWPRRDGWATAALPFDNAPIVGPPPTFAPVPLIGVWRLFQAEAARLERPAALVAATSVLACAAFPDALTDCGERLLASAGALVAAGRFGHLRFRKDPEFWTLLGDSERDGLLG